MALVATLSAGFSNKMPLRFTPKIRRRCSFLSYICCGKATGKHSVSGGLVRHDNRGQRQPAASSGTHLHGEQRAAVVFELLAHGDVVQLRVVGVNALVGLEQERLPFLRLALADECARDVLQQRGAKEALLVPARMSWGDYSQ